MERSAEMVTGRIHSLFERRRHWSWIKHRASSRRICANPNSKYFGRGWWCGQVPGSTWHGGLSALGHTKEGTHDPEVIHVHIHSWPRVQAGSSPQQEPVSCHARRQGSGLSPAPQGQAGPHRTPLAANFPLLGGRAAVWGSLHRAASPALPVSFMAQGSQAVLGQRVSAPPCQQVSSHPRGLRTPRAPW